MAKAQKSFSYFAFCLSLVIGAAVSQDECTYCGIPILSHKGKAKTLLTNVNKHGSAVERWIPPEDEEVCVVVIEGESLSITGRVCLFRDNELHEDTCIDIDVTLSGFAPIDECYCSSELSPFVEDFEDPNYRKIQKKCDLGAFTQRPSDANELLFCPACKGNTCQTAKDRQSVDGAPDPIYLNWNFYTQINGTLSGSGMDAFRAPVLKKVPDAPKGLTSCTPDISNLLLPQMYCSDPEDPVNGFGYGANAHSQKCGLGFWFNCEEDIPFLDEGKHCLDINMVFENCPSPPPTGLNPPATTPPFDIPCIPSDQVCDVWAVASKPNDKKQASALTTLDKKGIESRWIPKDEFLCVNFEGEKVHINGEVCLRRGKSIDEDSCLDINVTLSDHKTIDDCYCSSELAPWVDDFEYPPYKKVEKKCTMKTFNERPSDAENLLLCPACKKNTCQKAKQKQPNNGAPNPIYNDWSFYKEISGSISGAGMNKLLKKLKRCVPDIPMDITTCTPVVDNLFLPQMYCSDYEVPENGYGYGANAIDQECGLSFWFNCQEYLPYLEDVSHCLDLNLNFQSCPPTCVPTSSPTE